MLKTLLTQGPSESTTLQLDVLSGGRRRAPARLVGQGALPDPIVSRLAERVAEAPGGNALAGLIEGFSRGLADVLGVEEDTISEFLSNTTGLTVPEVHVALAAPLLAVPGLTLGVSKLLSEDLRAVAAGGDVQTVADLAKQAADIFTKGIPFRVGKTIAGPSLKRAQASFLREAKQIGEGARRVIDRLLRR